MGQATLESLFDFVFIIDGSYKDSLYCFIPYSTDKVFFLSTIRDLTHKWPKPLT